MVCRAAGQAYALSKPNHPALADLLHAQPIVAAPGHRIVIEPPSTLEALGGAAGPGQLGSSYQPAGIGYGSASLGLLDQQQQQQQPGDGGAGGAAEEAQPDDVLPLTRTQLQAKVSLAVPDRFACSSCVQGTKHEAAAVRA